MKIIVCDDNEQERQELIAYLRQSEQADLDVDIIEFSDGAELLKDSRAQAADILFLDIYMSKTHGMEAAQALRKNGFCGCIVFTTTSHEFGAQSYDVDATDYLVKPIAYVRFLEAMERCRKRIGKSKEYIELVCDKANIKVMLQSILYVETGNHCVFLHTENGVIRVLKTISEMEELLQQNKGFIRCHRSFIVNARKIQATNDTSIIMQNGEKILIAIRNSAKIRKQIAEFIWESMRE